MKNFNEHTNKCVHVAGQAVAAIAVGSRIRRIWTSEHGGITIDVSNEKQIPTAWRLAVIAVGGAAACCLDRSFSIGDARDSIHFVFNVPANQQPGTTFRVHRRNVEVLHHHPNCQRLERANYAAVSLRAIDRALQIAKERSHAIEALADVLSEHETMSLSAIMSVYSRAMSESRRI
ncbi:hypothetical protein ETAA8_06590 [Anatilimnocola aggregata]|uniref:Uncharacterized protein n=1 Tax=Anatilimnocola aggregata TaxID=2528021 RepID=A0A517Y5R8_9BACT|nr:hypothetical protein [Anatilimnocola aggregata]QDU25589.1 hypothetical protein ETAA8_06590 [Anatilimnocola aggregata]